MLPRCNPSNGLLPLPTLPLHSVCHEKGDVAIPQTGICLFQLCCLQYDIPRSYCCNPSNGHLPLPTKIVGPVLVERHSSCNPSNGLFPLPTGRHLSAARRCIQWLQSLKRAFSSSNFTPVWVTLVDVFVAIPQTGFFLFQLGGVTSVTENTSCNPSNGLFPLPTDPS